MIGTVDICCMFLACASDLLLSEIVASFSPRNLRATSEGKESPQSSGVSTCSQSKLSLHHCTAFVRLEYTSQIGSADRNGTIDAPPEFAEIRKLAKHSS